MPKSKLTLVPNAAGEERPVDAKAIAAHYGFTAKYICRLAATRKIPWHGMRFGAKVYRRFYLSEVRAALSHDVESPEPVGGVKENR